MLGKAKILVPVWGQRNIESLACMDNSGTCSWHHLFFDSLKDIAAMMEHPQHQSSRTKKICWSCWIFKPPSWPHLATQKSAQLPPLTWRFTMAGFTGATKPFKKMGSMWLFGAAKACCTFMSKYVQWMSRNSGCGPALNQKCYHGVWAAFFFFLSLKPESQ